MKYKILIERWKREAVEIEIEAKNACDTKQQGMDLYFGDFVETQFNDYGVDADIKDECITTYKQSTSRLLKESMIDSERNIFNKQ